MTRFSVPVNPLPALVIGTNFGLLCCVWNLLPHNLILSLLITYTKYSSSLIKPPIGSDDVWITLWPVTISWPSISMASGIPDVTTEVLTPAE